MKVIKEGRQQKGWAKEFVCSGFGNGNGGCGATLLVEQDDVYQTRYCQYGEDAEVKNKFRCPNCFVQTDIGHVPFAPRNKENASAKVTDEVTAVKALGEVIGYGRVMQLCEQIWKSKDGNSGELTVGCRSAFLVLCPNCLNSSKHCNWCCGSGRVTEKVAEAILQELRTKQQRMPKLKA